MLWELGTDIKSNLCAVTAEEENSSLCLINVINETQTGNNMYWRRLEEG